MADPNDLLELCSVTDRKWDVQSEIEYWNSAVLCSVLGANPPLEVIEGFIRRIWQAFEIDKICLVRKGVFLVRFKNISDQSTVVQRGIYFFDNKPFLVKPWNEGMDVNAKTLVTLSVWVRFPELDIKYWGAESLSKIGSVLGVPIKTDKYTRDNLHNQLLMQKVLLKSERRLWLRRRAFPMERICSWNIRGLNWPNKQEDVKIFLHEKDGIGITISPPTLEEEYGLHRGQGAIVFRFSPNLISSFTAKQHKIIP
ncbi:hypothetical protein Cgig2_024975 [Carnegiea gigantea]|uniref:DUF4283 domain-containing protein n=1 Tax=Carnegiea gigantea TaxID=171969 RepID=A0A9Q1JRM9_9CARY|nr:hypothetical protein Cgig2_024975 [Carnegiea gigantea]